MRLCDELVPGFAAGFEDGVVVLEEAVGEPVLTQVLPDVLDRVQLRRSGRQQDDGEVLGKLELVGAVLARAVHEDDGVRLGGDVAADLVEMHLHGWRVGPGQHESRALAVAGTDGAEEISILVALIGWQAGPRAGPGPQPGAAVLLAEPGLVLEPDLDRLVLGQMAYVGCERAREVFLNPSSTRGSCLGCCGRALI